MGSQPPLGFDRGESSPASPIRARRHGATPSISVSSEKLRNVLITTIKPSTRTLSRLGATATV
jgi:hypothetical protein